MSNEVFPMAVPGLDIKVSRAPIWSTEVLTTQSGKEQRASWWSTPRYRYAANFNFLRQGLIGDEAAALLGFFYRHKGQFDSFWLPDPAAVNLVPNPTSEQPAPAGGWPAGSFDGVGVVTGTAYTGTSSRRTTSNANIYLTPNIPCSPGDQFYAEAMVMGVGGIAGMVYIAFRDAVGALTGTSFAQSAVTSWTKVGVTGTAPAGTRSVSCFICSSASGTAYFDNLFFGSMDAAGLAAAPDGTTARVAENGYSVQMQRRVRFDSDELALERILQATAAGGGQTWEAKTVKMVSLK